MQIRTKKITLKNLTVFLVLLCLLSLPSNHSSYAVPAEIMMYPGEYLEYEVSFLGVNLGTIKTYMESATTQNGIPVYKTKAVMKSNEGIPFVDLNATFESWMDKSVGFSHKFTSNIKKGEKTWDFQQLEFNYTDKYYNFTKWTNNKVVEEKKINTSRKWNDGSSLFFLSRKFTDIKKTIKVPTIIDYDTAMTTLNFHGRKENVEIEAVNYPVRTLYFDGKADWEGVYGLKGSFEGWFSDDEASVPILAKMNVYVGKVVIKLVKWKREGWTPPKGN
ncbi:MAG: DUF3108 domain-containing protein [Candidatus Kapaibacteriota bacterium]|jgi:hypothetical protein